MAKRIKSHFIDSLNQRVNIVDIINIRLPNLKKKGRNYQACCPFHNEKTPSFSVEPIKGFYKCFGCGASGNAIKFVMEFEHLSFVESIEKIASEIGMTVEYEHNPNYSPEKAKAQKNTYDILEQASTLFQANLNNSSTTKQYLKKRGVSEAVSNTFALGHSEPNNQLLQNFTPDVPVDLLKQSGLVAQGDRGHYDQFRNRLMFPIRNHKGQVVGFGGRVLGDAKPKYLNSGESDIFQKRFVLYGLYETLKASTQISRLIVVEGYMDVIALYQSGITGAVATLGTSLTEDHVPLMRRFSNQICICFDGDKAGKKAAERAANNLLKSVSVKDEIRMVFLPEGEDPDSLVRRVGKKAFIERLQNGQVFSEYLYHRIFDGQNPNIVESRAEINRRSREIFNEIPASEYKSLLEKGLRRRLGEDSHSQNRTFRSNKTWNKNFPKSKFQDNQDQKQQPKPNNSLSAEAKLIRIALEYPEFSEDLPDLSVLASIQSKDATSLLTLFDTIQASPPMDQADTIRALPNEVQVSVINIVNAFERGWFHIEDETPEERKSRLMIEFSETFKQLISKQLKLLSIRGINL